MALPNPEIHDLAKIDKLLDRIENEMKKKRNKNFFSSPEKYTNYMNKTTELYSLISEEVISFLDVLGLAEYMTTFQKLFRGLQQQIHSMLKFTLHYYNAKSLQVREAMITGKMPTTASGETNIKPGISFTVKIQKSNFPGQPAQSQTARDRTVSTFAGTQQPQTAANIASPYNLPDQSGIESVGNSHSGPYYLKDEHTRNFSNLPRNPYFGSPSTARSGFGSDMMSLDQDDIYETENYQHEYERIQKEIHELLESKEHIMKIQPTTLALNLKQVLRSLENTKKNTKIVIDESSDDEDIGDQQDLELMMKKLMGACSQAQKKTFQKIVDYIQNCKNQGQVLFRKDQATMPDPKMLEIDKKIMKRELEAVVQQRQQEINFLKKRVETLEQDRDLAEEKHAKLLIEHSSCEQEKKDNALQVSALEAEIASLKEIIQEGRKGRFSREPQTPLDSPVLRPAQSNAQGVSEVNRRILEQMSQYRAEIEALKLDLREERRSNMTSKLLDSNPISGLQSPARSPVKLNSQTSQPTRSMAGTPVTTKSVAKGKFVFNEKSGGKVLKEAKEVKENQENNSRDTSMSKDNRSHSQLPSRRGSVMKQENNLNLVMNSTRDGYHGESEFKKRKNNPSSGGVDVEQENRNDALEETDSYQYGQTERGENNENEMAEQQQENEMSERMMEKGENRETSTKGEVKSHNKIKRDNTAGKGSVTVKASPTSTLTKLPTADRGQSEEKSLPVNAKKNKGSEKAAPSKIAAKSSEKPSVPSLQEYGQLKKAGSKDDLTIGVDESKAKNIHVKKAPANSQQTKQNNVEKPKELAKGAGMDDDYLLKESKSTRVEKKEQIMARHDLLSSSPKKVEESRREHHSVGVDKAVQTDDIGPVSFRESRRNLSISKEVYNKPYNLVSPGYKGMNNTTSGFGGQGLNLIQSDFKPSRDNSESRLASLVAKTDNKPKIGKSLMPSFEAKIKHPVSVIEDKSLMNEDSARTNKGRFQTDIDQSSERVYDDWEVHPKHYSKEDQAKIKRLTPLDKDVFMKVQMRSATSSSPVNYRESSAEPHEGDDSQINGMYKAMLAKAEQDPKILTILKTYAKEKGEPVEEDTDFIPDYTLFADYLQDLRLAHQKCGENCSHLQRFYSRIGYYHFWNKRAPLTMKKPDISEEYGPKKKVPSRLPNIPEKKVLKMTS